MVGRGIGLGLRRKRFFKKRVFLCEMIKVELEFGYKSSKANRYAAIPKNTARFTKRVCPA